MIFTSQKPGYYTSQLDSLLRISKGHQLPGIWGRIDCQVIGRILVIVVLELKSLPLSTFGVSNGLLNPCQAWNLFDFLLCHNSLSPVGEMYLLLTFV